MSIFSTNPNLSSQVRVLAAPLPPHCLPPVFIRLPKVGKRCNLTGLSRGSLCELVLPTEKNGFCPPVKSYVQRKKGATRGIRLIEFESLVSYLRSMPVS